jgi:hypothetical protein
MIRKISRENSNQLAEHLPGNPPLVIPNLQTSNFVAKQIGKECTDYDVSPRVSGRELFVEQTAKEDARFLTIEDQLNFAEQYNYIAYIYVYPGPFLVEMAARRCSELQWQEENIEDSLQIKKIRRLKTPYRELTERTLYDKKSQLTHHPEKMINSEADVKAMAWIIKESIKVVMAERDEIKKEILTVAIPRVKQIREKGLSLLGFQSPIHEVLYPHLSQMAQIYFMHDYPDLFTELLDVAAPYTELLVESAIEANVDIIQTALWGYDQWSPTIYQKYVLPYIIPVARQIKERRCLFAVHTCGHMKGLLEDRTYDKIKPDILECLNSPPCGDVDDWPRLRSLLPEETISKGNLDDALLLLGPVEEIRKRTRKILKESEGFKHILSSGNNVLDDTPLAHFEAMMEAVAGYNENDG